MRSFHIPRLARGVVEMAAVSAFAALTACGPGAGGLAVPHIATAAPSASPSAGPLLPNAQASATSTVALSAAGGLVALPALPPIAGSVAFPAAAPFVSGTTATLTTYAINPTSPASVARKVQSALRALSGAPQGWPQAGILWEFSAAYTVASPITLTVTPAAGSTLAAAAAGGLYAVMYDLPGSGVPTQVFAAPIVVGGTTANPTLTFSAPAATYKANEVYAILLYSGTPPAAPIPAVYAVDSTNTLVALDATGNVLGSVHIPGTVSDINGGEVAIGPAGNVYVTEGQPTNAVVAYSFANGSFAQVALGSSAFKGLFVPRGIVYDAGDARFFVANGGATVNAFDSNGNSVAYTPATGIYGPSGLSYDAANHVLWVANFQGYFQEPPAYGVAVYDPLSGISPTSFNQYDQFGFFGDFGVEPYSVAYCTANVNAGTSAPFVAVGFIGDGGFGTGSPIVALFMTGGHIIGSVGNHGDIVEPYQLACDSQDNVWVADRSGLLRFGSNGQAKPFVGASSLKPPVFGVAVNI